MEPIVNLQGKRILIIGASSGIGKAVAVLAAEVGAQCVLAARNEEKLAAVCREIGESACYRRMDLSHPECVEAVLQETAEENGPFDGAVYSAGVGTTLPVKNTTYEKIRTVMDVNFFGYVEMIRVLSQKKYHNPGLSIVGISSAASLFGSKGKTAYCASKAAMDAVSRCMAVELGERHIRINTVRPSWVKTEMYESWKEQLAMSEYAQGRMKRQYLGIAEPEDIANAVVFLLSDAARHMTGTSVSVDGGAASC